MEQLIGKIPVNVTRRHDAILFNMSDGTNWILMHDQDCCEEVTLEDVTGDLTDLVGRAITHANERTQDDPNAYESGTWSFYNVGNHWQTVQFRFYGSSNGYYSETASLFPCTVTGEILW